jgi:hypothetical protein
MSGTTLFHPTTGFPLNISKLAKMANLANMAKMRMTG